MDASVEFKLVGILGAGSVAIEVMPKVYLPIGNRRGATRTVEVKHNIFKHVLNRLAVLVDILAVADEARRNLHSDSSRQSLCAWRRPPSRRERL